MNYDLGKDVFKKKSEFHYAQNTAIDETIYPQVHDFYEIFLLLQGNIDFTINDNYLHLKKGNLILIRPGDIHAKKYQNNKTIKCINLAFTNHTLKSLFYYIYGSSEWLERITQSKDIIMTMLSEVDIMELENKISLLSFISTNDVEKQNRYLRAILVQIILFNLLDITDFTKRNDFPNWLNNILDGLNDIQNLQNGLDYILSSSERTQSHVCRAFVKYLNMTPTSYINHKRLNYAANLLAHSDKEIIDIIYEIGFNSVSNFYHLFKNQYGITPLKYRYKYSYNFEARKKED